MEIVAGLVAISVTILYVLGLMTVNLYLSKLGTVDFSLIRGRYISLGVLVACYFLFVGVIPCLGLFVAYQVGKVVHPEMTTNLATSASAGQILWTGFLLGSILLLGASVLVTGLGGVVGPWWVLNRYVATSRREALSAFYFGIVVVIMPSFLVWLILPQLPEAKDLNNIAAIVTAVLTITVSAIIYLSVTLLALGLSLRLFAERIFPQIPALVGGGKPRTVKLLVAKEAIEGVRQLGIPLPNETNESPQHLTYAVIMLFEGTSTYILRLRENGEVIQIAKNVVVGISTPTPES